MLIRFLQMLPSFKGKRRLCRWLLRNYTNSKKDIIVKGDHHLRYKVPNFTEVVGFDILIDGAYEKETSDFIINKLPKNGVFIDVGANIGAISLPVCRQRGDVTCIMIEASPRVFNYLEYNTQLNNLQNGVLINKALAAQDGQKVNFFSPAVLFGKGSMSAVYTEEAEETETITLDTLLDRQTTQTVDFIKTDVEGYEYYAFLGGKNQLSSSSAPDILFEFVDWAEKQARNLNPGDAQQLLMEYGYLLYEFKSGKPVGKPLVSPVTEGSLMLYATKERLTRQ